MKPSIKYPVTLLLLLLTGYTQVFAHLGNTPAPYSSINEVKGLKHFQVLVTAPTKAEIFIEEEEEEEDKRNFLKEYSKTKIYTGVFYDQLPEYFFQRLKNNTINKYPHFSFFGSSGSIFHVLRL